MDITAKDIRFYELFTKLVSLMTDVEGPPRIAEQENLLVEICELLRISKAYTRLYRNPKEEMTGGGEYLCSRDTGEECTEVHRIRAVTKVMSIAEQRAFMKVGDPPLTEEELARVDLVMRTTVTYLIRNRLRDIVEELAYNDDQGYRNSRLYMMEIMKKAATRRIGGMVAVNYNLRHFTLVNQQCGRDAGDEILMNHYKGFERLIGEEGCVCRLGGDNFVAIFSEDKLTDVTNYLTETKIHFDCDGGGDVSIHCSAGIYCIPGDIIITDPGDVLSKIIAAFRVAQNGNTRMVYYDDALIAKKQASMKIQEIFPGALKNEEFRVFYQPKVNILTGEVSGAEALCRWFRDGRVIPPFEFIPVLEQTNDICKLDFYMLEHVCKHMREWLDEGRKVVRISVNMSRRHMTDENLLRTIMGIIDWYSIPHELIEIELTETTTDVGFTDLKRVVGGLSQENICTSIDDFGMGYSSLNLIRGIPWNVLKIDRSFMPVTEGEPDRVNDIMFRSVVKLSREIGLECVVEGVETVKHLEILRENGCEMAQGFLFDKPLSVEEFKKRLDKEFRYKVDY